MKSIFIYNGDELVKELAILHDGYWYCQYAVRSESNVLSVISMSEFDSIIKDATAKGYQITNKFCR